MKFTLINPYTVGPAKTTVNAPTPIQGAKKLYGNISQYFTNNLPSWFFTIQDGKGKMHHFEINEKKSGKNVDFTIRAVGMKEEGESRLRDLVAQKGGESRHHHHHKKTKDDESSSSSSSSDSFWSKRSRRYYPSYFEDFLYLSLYYTVDNVLVDTVYFPPLLPTVAPYPRLLLTYP
jgi:hypothetical protein